MRSRLGALDFLTACLGVQKTPADIANLRGAIVSGKPDWEKITGLANANFLSPAFWVEVRDNALAQSLPNHVRDYLAELHRLNTLRNQRLREQTIETARHLNAAGVTPVVLKGAASLVSPTYSDEGSRMMVDLDILVPAADGKRCWDHLCARGYCPIQSDYDWSHHHHLQTIYCNGEAGTVEIHRQALMPFSTGRIFGASLTPEEVEQITQRISANAVLVSGYKVRLAMPAATERVLLCLLHSALYEKNAYRCGTLPLKSLHELAVLQCKLADRVDWKAIRQLLARGRKLALLDAWLFLAHKLFGSALPPGMRTTPGMAAHYVRARIQARWALSVSLTQISRA
jgi:hypothetical protein